MAMPDIPMYVFTGFLESGKTKFIQETLEDPRFNTGERTLLLCFEEGVEEYDISTYPHKEVYVQELEYEDLSPEMLTGLQEKYRAERVVVELNGMHLASDFYLKTPEHWKIAQEIMFADATTFLSYNANMRQLVYDKLKSCELVVFNRFKPDMDKMEFHKIVRAASRRADIAYEYAGGKVEYDDIVDPLPFDINAPIIEIGDADFAEWYRDMSEEPKKYENKTVRFKCRALVRKKMPEHSFIVGRHVMTCCVEDIQFAGLVCQWDKANTVQDDTWIILTARINFKFNRAYSRKGPVLTYIDAEPCEAPEQPVATFY